MVTHACNTATRSPDDLTNRIGRCQTVLKTARALAIESQWSDPRLIGVIKGLQETLWRVKAMAGRTSVRGGDPKGLHPLLTAAATGLYEVELAIQQLAPRLRSARKRRPNVTLVSA